MADDRKDLPPANSPNFLEKVREAVQTYMGNRGNKLDRGLTVRDLADAGLIDIAAGYLSGKGKVPPVSGIGTAIEGAYQTDLTPPPTPSLFSATAAISNIMVTCGPPTYAAGNGHAKSRLYGSTWTTGDLPVFANAVMLTEFPGTVASYATNPATTWHLWLTWVSVDGVESTSPAGGTNGVVVKTGEDVGLLLEALTGEITASQLHNDLGTRINLIDGPDTDPASVAGRILAEAQARGLSEAALTLSIASEAADRISDIATMATQIESEATARGIALEAESLARLNADIEEAAARADKEALAAKQLADQTEASADALLRSVLAADAEKLGAASAIVATQNQLTEQLTVGLLAEATHRSTLAAKLDTDIASTLAVIASEETARSTALAAEASQREILAAQFRGDYTGNDPAQLTEGLLYQERITRAAENEALAQQITLLSAGAGEQFDWKAIWYFDSGSESWSGNGTPTATGGWLRPANQVAGAYVNSPSGIGSNGNTYSQMRLRVRKVGSPVWAGAIYWRASTDTTWDVSRSFALPEPTWDGNGIGLVTETPGWAVTVDRIRVDLSSAQTDTNYFELDWVAIGRPSPGASSAQIVEEATARAASDLALTQSITNLSSQVNNATTGLPATRATLLEEQTTRATADTAEAAARTDLAARVTTTEGAIVTNASAISTEATARADADTAIAGTVTALSAVVTDPATGLDKTRADLIVTQETLTTATTANAKEVRELKSESAAIDEATLRDILTGQAVKDAYEGSVAMARQDLTTQIEDGVSAEAKLRLALAAVVDTTAATLTQEMETRASETEALSTSVTTLSAITDGNTSAITQEATSRADATEAIARTLTTLKAETGSNTAAVGVEKLARTTEAESLARAITVLTATTGDNAASVSQEALARTTATEALSSSVTALFAETGSSKSALKAEEQARSTDTEALASSITALSASTGSNAAALSVETSTRTTETGALAVQVTSLFAETGGNTANIVETQKAITDAAKAYAIDQKVLRSESAAIDEATLLDVLNSQAVKDAYAGELAMARQDLTTQIDVGVSAEAKARLELTAIVNTNAATLVQESITRATETEALSRSIETLTAVTDGNTASIVSENEARTTKDIAVASQVDRLYAATGANSAGIIVEKTARADQDSAIGSQVTSVAAKTGENAAVLIVEQTARTTQNSSMSSQVASLAASTGNNFAGLVTKQSTLTDDYNSLAARSTAIEASYNDLMTDVGTKATITYVDDAKADAISASASSITQLASKIISRPNLLKNGGFENGTSGWASLDTLTVVDSFWGKSLTCGAHANGTFAVISDHIAVQAGASYIIHGDSMLFATSGFCYFDLMYYGPTGTLLLDSGQYQVDAPHDFSETDANRGVHAAPSVAPAGATYATARFIFSGTGITAVGCRNIKVERGELPYTPYTTEGTQSELSSALQIEAETRADQTGDLYAQYTVKLDVDDKVSGFGLASTGPKGTGSIFEVRADKFAIAAPTGSAAGVVPFSVLTSPVGTPGDPGYIPAGTYIDTAFIKNGTITGAQIHDATIDLEHVTTSFVTDLTAQTITANNMKSSNYLAGTQGWALKDDGTAELANAVVRGAVYATSGYLKGLDVMNSAGAVILSVGNTLQAQIAPYESGATAGADWSKNVANKPTTLSALDSTAATALSNKLSKNSADTLSSVLTVDTTTVAGLRVGTLMWDSAGNRTSGSGVAMTPKGIVGHDGIKETFVVGTDGNATFAGELAAATGTFAGELAAATGTFAGSLSAVSGSFSGSLSSATGTFSGSLTAAAINAVNTINIGANAVTLSVVGYSAGLMDYAPTNSDMQSATIGCYGGQVFIAASTFVETGTGAANLSIRRNGVEIMSIPLVTYGLVTASFGDWPGEGSFTYTMTCVTTASNRRLFSKRSLFVLETRR